MCGKCSSRCYVHGKQHQPLFCLLMFLYDFPWPSSLLLQDPFIHTLPWPSKTPGRVEFMKRLLKEGRQEKLTKQTREGVRIPGRENSKNKVVEAQKSKCLLTTSRFLSQGVARLGRGLLQIGELRELSPLDGSSISFSSSALGVWVKCNSCHQKVSILLRSHAFSLKSLWLSYLAP